MVKRKLTLASEMGRGKKRLQNGSVKDEGDGSAIDGLKTIERAIKKLKTRSDNDNDLNEEIRALGGTKEDVDLIADIASESEMEGNQSRLSKHLGNGLEKELAQLVQQLGVHRVAQKELMAGFESDDATETEELKDGQDAHEPPPSSKMIDLKSVSQAAICDGQGQKSLVSK